MCQIVAYCSELGLISSWSHFHAEGLLSGILSSFLKIKKAQSMCSTDTRPPDLFFFFFFAFLHHLLKPASHLLLGFTCSTKTSSLRQRGFGKYPLSTVLGSGFYIQADLITKSSTSRVSWGRKQWRANEAHLPISLPFSASMSIRGQN